MPVTESGYLTQFAYVPEVAFGTTPASPVGQLLRWIPGTDMGADRSFTTNPEIRTDYMKAAGIPGGFRGKGKLVGKLSYGSYDDLFGYSLGCAAWASNVIKIRPITTTGAISLAVDSVGKTFTRTVGSFVTDGFQVGDVINPFGFTSAANNAAFVISGVTALVITCSTATTLVTETAAAGRTIVLDISPSFTLERGHKGNGIFFAFPGTVVDGFEISGKSGNDSTVNVTFDLLSKVVSNESATSIFASLTQPNTNDLFTSWSGTIKKGGTSILDVVGWDIKVARNSDTAEVCGSPDLYDIQPKAATVTGKLEIYFDSMANYTDFRLQNDVAFQINLGSGSSKSYTVDLTRGRITKWGAPPKDGMMTSTIEFESVVPIAGTNTAFMLTRIP